MLCVLPAVIMQYDMMHQAKDLNLNLKQHLNWSVDGSTLKTECCEQRF